MEKNFIKNDMNELKKQMPKIEKISKENGEETMNISLKDQKITINFLNGKLHGEMIIKTDKEKKIKFKNGKKD